MAKAIMDFRVVKAIKCHPLYTQLVLEPASQTDPLPQIKPGQFVQVSTGDKGTFLRRPISINLVDKAERQLALLIRRAGDGTAWLTDRCEGDIVNLLLPLGNGFDLSASKRPLLVGGGVGVAPMLELAHAFNRAGIRPTMLIGARSKEDVLQHELFAECADVAVTTEDGSMGEKGLVTVSKTWQDEHDAVYCCGPAPMMKAVARVCRDKGVRCFVSLENMMACGLGACLCCVEKTVKGNVCVCTDGPVFDTEELTWE